MIGAGKSVRSGDTIPYVVCRGAGAVADRSYHPESVIKAEGLLSVDVEWYLTNQLLPPVTRLCAVMDESETDVSRLAQCLGIEHVSNAVTADGRNRRADEDDLSWITGEDDEERYKDAPKLMIACPDL